jgi:predicted GNAT superfamily acetyltransferase
VIEICSLHRLDALEQAVEVQRAVWRLPDLDLNPVRWFVVADHVGGQVFGAYDGARMIGFCAAVPGIKTDGSVYLHSHMLAVLPEYRDSGIGRRLKLFQRDDALRRNIRLVEWTFDPLELKNAWFNIERLGATVRTYLPNQYGTMGSAQTGWLPSDRLLAEWNLDSERVVARVSGGPVGNAACIAPVRVSYPASIGRMRLSEPERAREIQRRNGEKLASAFAQGYAITGFERTDAEGAYILEARK